MDEKKLLQFIDWLGKNVPELQGSSPDEIASKLNTLSESEEGKEMLQGLIKEFESNTQMFKKGGKLDYLICLKKGGSIQDCGCGNKIEKGQDGFTLSRKQMLDNSIYDKKNTIQRYKTALYGLKSTGQTGRPARMTAREMAMGYLPAVEDSVTVIDLTAPSFKPAFDKGWTGDISTSEISKMFQEWINNKIKK